jgi:hypothetical protein
MNKQEKWWKIIPVALFSFGVLVGLLALLPEFSPPFLVIGVIIGLVATISGIIQRIDGFEWFKFITAQAALLIFFLIGARYLLFYMNNTWIWIVPFVIAYLFAWLLPYLYPGVSELLFQEQMTPKTDAGKAFMRVAWAILPIAGAGGAFIGMYINRAGEMKNASALLGPLFMIVAIGWAQSASHQLREERNRRKEVTI